MRLVSFTLVFGSVLPVSAGAAMREDIERAVHDATVLVAADCTGVLAEGPDLVLTAEHCVRGQSSLELTFANGTRATAWVAAVDRLADQALLLLEEPAALMPLAIARRRPFAGTILYFAGNPRAPRFHEVELQRVGRWPKLPLLQNALFTNIKGSPGDAGAPIVNTAGRIVGIMHGGQEYNVATPAHTLRRLVNRLLGDDPMPSRLPE